MKPMAKFHVYLAFLCGTILPRCLQTGVAAMENPSTTSPPVDITQAPTSPSQTDPSTTVIPQDLLTTLPSQETTMYTTKVTTFVPPSSVQTTVLPTQTTTTQSPSPETSTSPPLASTLPPDVPSQESVTLSENPTKAELCEENNKRLMLICLIVIGLLVFFCVCLLLVVVVMASKLSHVKRSQASRRLPRNNGDFLTASSLWPVGLETLQRMNTEMPETSPGQERTTSGPGKVGEEASRKLASEISIRQKNKEMSPKETSEKARNSSISKTEI
ncbi:uncharacterized protein LOC100563951 [Anolis carolinensis]|uniref:uncharacterized protein LOC100563951 n=1 Tax=Anolis carolinensis TaxID=28377 RepID=UPI002F2B17EC